MCGAAGRPVVVKTTRLAVPLDVHPFSGTGTVSDQLVTVGNIGHRGRIGNRTQRAKRTDRLNGTEGTEGMWINDGLINSRPGDLFQLAPEPPIGAEWIVRGGPHDGQALLRGPGGGWQLGIQRDLEWPAVAKVLVEAGVWLEVVVPIRRCARDGCAELFAAKGKRKFHQPACQVAQWRADHDS